MQNGEREVLLVLEHELHHLVEERALGAMAYCVQLALLGQDDLLEAGHHVPEHGVAPASHHQAHHTVGGFVPGVPRVHPLAYHHKELKILKDEEKVRQEKVKRMERGAEEKKTTEKD